MIDQLLTHIFSDTFLLICAATMLSLFIFDILGTFGKYIGLRSFRKFDFKGPIVSIGLFGTFTGVLVGLYGFDPKEIALSVPRLLEGLKFAFATSVLGMCLSLILSILDKFSGGLDDDSDILRDIDNKLGQMINVVKSPQELVTQFSEMKSFLKNHLEKINTSLDKALEQLARGATQEVIQALQKIITEFNKNLLDQFGDNFKELNVACHKMVEWQDKYRNHVDTTEARVVEMISLLNQAREAVSELTKRNKETADVCKDVSGLIKTYDIQIKTLATYLESCKKLGDQAGSFLSNTELALNKSNQNLDAFSGMIAGSCFELNAYKLILCLPGV